MATSLLNFFDKLRIASYTFELGENLIHSRTGGGQILTAETGPRLWKGSITLGAMSHDHAREQAALVGGMMNAGVDFEITDKKRQYPLRYPNGLPNNGSASPNFDRAGSSGRTFRFTSRAAGVVFSPGDLFSFYGAWGSGSFVMLNEVSVGATTPASGQAFTLTMANPIRGDLATASSWTFERPFCNAIIVPGSVTPFSRFPDHASGMSFEWIQSVRRFS